MIPQMRRDSSALAARQRHPLARGRRGAMVVLIALLLIVFLVTVIFSVDVAYMHLTRAQLRTATDAGARAGGEALSRLQDQDLARQAAKDIAAANLVAGQGLELDDADVLFGSSTQQSDGSWAFTAGAAPTNSVQVIGRRTSGAPSGAVGTFLGRIFGVPQFEPTQTATVVVLDRDICLVVDRSSSMKLGLASTAETMSTSDPRFSQPPNMSDSRWGALSVAVQDFIDALATTPQTETLALVSFASDGTWCGVVNKASETNQQLDFNHASVTSAMATISGRVFNGMTNTAAGIDAGVAVLTDATRCRPYAAKMMVLLSDGHSNQGRAPLLAAQDAAAREIVIHTVTFGNGANEGEMAAVAEATGGNHYSAYDADSLRDVFRKIALTLPVVMTQ
jgi:Ca-activated chloride channel family protein